MYMPNASPNARRPNATYIPLTRVLGFRVGGNTNFSVRVGGNTNFSVRVGGNTNFSVRVGGNTIFSFLDTNMLVFPTQNFALGV